MRFIMRVLATLAAFFVTFSFLIMALIGAANLNFAADTTARFIWGMTTFAGIAGVIVGLKITIDKASDTV